MKKQQAAIKHQFDDITIFDFLEKATSEELTEDPDKDAGASPLSEGDSLLRRFRSFRRSQYDCQHNRSW